MSNDYSFLQSLINSSIGSVTIPYGTYSIDRPLVLTKNVNIDGGFSTIINQNINPRTTTDAIFNLMGSIKKIGTCKGLKGSSFITAQLSDNLLPGDLICTQVDYPARNIAVVVSISDKIFLDRPLTVDTNDILYKISPVRDITVKNFNIDFNGKYGHGIYAKYCYNVNIQNINAKNLGSKVVLLESSANCRVRDINCDYAFDVKGDGGCGYVVRLSVCNDCSVEQVIGSRVRHVVDLSGSNRNIIRNCEGYNNYSADFLTHSNGCKENSFEYNKTLSNQTAGYSFTTKSGDNGNRIIGGSVYNSPFIYQDQDSSTIIKNVYINSQEKYTLTNQGIINFQNCDFDCNYTLISGLKSGSIINFNGCSFKMNNPYSLGSNNLGIINFYNCRFEATVDGKMIRTTPQSLVRFNNNCLFINCNIGTLI